MTSAPRSPPTPSMRPKGVLTGALQDYDDLRQRSGVQRRRLESDDRRLHNGAPVRIRDIGQAAAGRRERSVRRLDLPGQGQSGSELPRRRRVELAIFKQPARTSSRPSSASRPRCRSLRPACRRRSRMHVVADRTQTIRASVADVALTLVSRPAGDRCDLPVPAQRARHADSERRAAAVAAR